MYNKNLVITGYFLFDNKVNAISTKKPSNIIYLENGRFSKSYVYYEEGRDYIDILIEPTFKETIVNVDKRLCDIIFDIIYTHLESLDISYIKRLCFIIYISDEGKLNIDNDIRGSFDISYQTSSVISMISKCSYKRSDD